jgi:hypothetical protein
MSRADLLALTPDDLAALTNRGTVKRAQRELETGEATFTLNESDAGEITVEWSDQSRCVLPARRSIDSGVSEAIVGDPCCRAGRLAGDFSALGSRADHR